MMWPLPAVAPSGDVAVVLQFAGVFTPIGTAVAARSRRRNPTADAWLLTARWTLAGTGIGTVFVVLMRVL